MKFAFLRRNHSTKNYHHSFLCETSVTHFHTASISFLTINLLCYFSQYYKTFNPRIAGVQLAVFCVNSLMVFFFRFRRSWLRGQRKENLFSLHTRAQRRVVLVYGRRPRTGPSAPRGDRIDAQAISTYFQVKTHESRKCNSWVFVFTLQRKNYCPQQCLYFLPLPHGHGSLRPIFSVFLTVRFTGGSSEELAVGALLL